MKKTLRLLLLVIASATFAATSIAQNTKYQRVLGGNADDNNYGIDRTLDGGLIMTGYTKSFGSGGEDIYLIKTNGLGQVEWSKAYGGRANESGWAVRATSDSGFVIAGSTNTLGEADGFIMKTDKSGNQLWSTTITGDSIDDLYNIIQSKFGGYYAVGYSFNDSFFRDMFVVKINNSGTVIWARNFGSRGDEEAYAIAEDEKGYLAITGVTNYDSTTVGGRTSNWGDEDIVVAICDSFGTLKFMFNYGSTDAELGWDIKPYGRDQYAITGWTKNLPFGGDDAFLMLIDTTGGYKVTYGFGTPGDERVFDVEIKPDLGFIISGYLQANGGDRDVMLLNIDAKGGLKSYAILGGANTDGHWPTDAIRTRDGGYNIISSAKSFRTGKGSDYYLIRATDQLVSGCNQKLDLFNVNQASFSRYGFGGTDFGYALDKPGFTTTNVTSFDSTLCCQLESRVAADTIKMCEGKSVFIGKEAISGYNYSWTAVGGSFTSSLASPQVSPTTTTRYKLVVSSSDGKCKKDSGFILVQVFNTIKSDIVRDTAFCFGDTVTISAHSGLNGHLWLGKTITATTATIKMAATDTVFFSAFDNNSCAYFDTLKTLRNPLPVFNLGRDTNICENLPITLTGPAGMKTYNWNNGQASTQSLKTNAERRHWLVATDNNGCVFSDSIQIFTNPFSSFSLGNDTSFCEGSSYTIPGPGALSGYIWNGVPGSPQNLTVNKVGWYYLTAVNSFKCPFTDSIYISQKAAPKFNLGDSINLCLGQSKTLTGPDKMKSYNWSNGPVTKAQNITNSGTYRLTVTDSAGCSYTDTVVLVQKFPTVVDLGNDTTICFGDSILIDAGPGVSYAWSNGKTTRTIYAKVEANYSVQVTNTFGCVGADNKQVDTIKCQTGLVKLPLGMAIQVYPNPSRGALTLEFEGNTYGDWKYEIADMSGRKIQMANMNITGTNGTLSIDLSNQAKGVYFLNIFGTHGSAVYRIVLE
jgi:hypothetical protein